MEQWHEYSKQNITISHIFVCLNSTFVNSAFALHKKDTFQCFTCIYLAFVSHWCTRDELYHKVNKEIGKNGVEQRQIWQTQKKKLKKNLLQLNMFKLEKRENLL